jgi:hypothetical protein
VSVSAAIASTVLWFRARGERREAARQAGLANDAAIASAGHLERIAVVQEEQHRAAADQQMILERDPWEIHPDPSRSAEADLYNDSDTPKYKVTVQISVNGQPYLDPETIDFVSPRRRARIAYIDLSAEISAKIIWYLDEACTVAAPAPQIITW